MTRPSVRRLQHGGAHENSGTYRGARTYPAGRFIDGTYPERDAVHLSTEVSDIEQAAHISPISRRAAGQVQAISHDAAAVAGTIRSQQEDGRF